MKRILAFIFLGWWMEILAFIGAVLFILGCYLSLFRLPRQ